ncbi:hypothetical protein DUNSADRAFT_16409 [Dunaliella salina]|uniref:Uncharacterized protein n=1 Tax=Dunaliella salina TaxID=3046 RepID=A0ABQ7G3M1_DUNSA|nr:hypothetical protein DUNSADRAFT_16409 [Dunaliella salina]|eukprot:KAF5829205.1 hypothetical protein DUNSADRAFT_16409 [Dunaliella salina]
MHAGGGARDVEGVPLEELVVDERSRRTLANYRDAARRVAVQSPKAQALTDALAQHQALRDAAAPSRDAAFMAAYKSFLHLVAAEEEKAAAHPMRTEVEEHDAHDREDEIRRARLDHLYAQLRAFLRKYLPETAAIAPQLAQELSSHTLPPRVSEVLQEVLKCEL